MKGKKYHAGSAIIMGFLFLFLETCAQGPDAAKLSADTSISRIAFGSCAHQNKNQPILRSVLLKEPDLFIYLGDNIYGDTRDMLELRAKYEKLRAKPEFQELRANTQILATWDDHDYGENDAGRHFPEKEVSREIFLNFWEEPANSERRKHAGVYHSEYFGPAERRVQVILLDTRTFRDDLVLNREKKWLNDYMPNTNPDSTFLGAEQWAWLKLQLEKPARIRIIASSNQFGHTYNGWESWNNVPHERNRMLSLIKNTSANGILFISGDVHWGEISAIRSDSLYPIYDVTSSGLTQTWPKIEKNQNRIGKAVAKNNFGLISIDWELPDPEITLQIIRKNNKTVVEHKLSLSELDF